MRRKSFVFSIEALLALAAALTLASYPLVSPSALYGDVHLVQLCQDLLEVTAKSPENARALAQFSATGESAFLEAKFSALLVQLGNYCVHVEARGKTMEANCEREGGEGFSAERIFWDGAAFTTVRLTVSLNRGA